VLNVVNLLISLIDEHVIWLYGICLLLILWYLRAFARARRERVNTVFTIEKEIAAHKEGRALSSIGVVLAVVVIITAFRFYVMPAVDIRALVEPTPTVELIVPTEEPTGTPQQPTPQPPTYTLTPRATRTPLPSVTPRPATPAPPAACPDPNICITQPGMNARVSGTFAIRGTATLDAFQFYKVEYGQGETPTVWNVIHDVHRTQVNQGVLEEWNTAGLPDGVYWLRLTVVDHTGNFPAPCQVRIVVQN